MTDLREDRAVAALRGLLEPLPELARETAPPGQETLGIAGPSPTPRSAGVVWLVAAAALVASLVLQALTFSPAGSPAGGSGSGTLPSHLPSYPLVAASAERQPAGSALLVAGHGNDELLDLPRTVALGADGRSYRRITTADVSHDQERVVHRPVLLSPDGRTVALGSAPGAGDLRLLDLTTGRVARYQVRPGASTFPVGWSADGGRVFVTAAAGLSDRADEQLHTLVGGWTLHEVKMAAPAGSTAASVPFSGDAAAGVAPLPDGRLLVSDGSRTQLRTPDGRTVLDPDTGVPPELHTTSVSPDGSRVVTGRGSWASGLGATATITPLVDGRVAGPASEVSTAGIGDPADAGSNELLGWVDDTHLLVAGSDNATGSLRTHLGTVDVQDGTAVELAAEGDGLAGNGYHELSAAADLLRGLQVSDVGRPDYGWTPWLVRLLAGLALALLAVVPARRLAAEVTSRARRAGAAAGSRRR